MLKRARAVSVREKGARASRFFASAAGPGIYVESKSTHSSTDVSRNRKGHEPFNPHCDVPCVIFFAQLRLIALRLALEVPIGPALRNALRLAVALARRIGRER